MEDNATLLDDNTPNGKVFTERMFWSGVFLGGPLIAGYLFSNNLKVFRKTDNTVGIWAIAVVATVMIIGGMFLIPEDFNIPNVVFPAIYSGISIALFHRYITEETESHINQGGATHSWGKTIGVSLLFALISAGPILGYALWSEAQLNKHTVFNSYGLMKEHSFTYDNRIISSDQVGIFGKGLIAIGIFGPLEPRHVFIRSEEYKYIVYLNMPREIHLTEQEPDINDSMRQLRQELSGHIKDKNIQINLFDQNLDDIIKVFN